MSTETELLEKLIEDQQAIIENLTAIVKDQREAIEAEKKTVGQMQADRADELESVAAKNLQLFEDNE